MRSCSHLQAFMKLPAGRPHCRPAGDGGFGQSFFGVLWAGLGLQNSLMFILSVSYLYCYLPSRSFSLS